MTIDKRMMTNFTLESLQNFNIHQAVFEACMEEVEVLPDEVKPTSETLSNKADENLS